MMLKSMTESKKIPHLGYKEQIEMEMLINARKQLKEFGEKRNIKISFMPFIVKATSLALSEYPIINSSLKKDNTEVY